MTRQEAINVILTLWKFVDRSHDSDIGIDSELIRQAFNLAIKALEEDWILCSERLPDEYGNYLISIKGEEPDIGTINPNDPRGWSLCDANGFYWANDKMLNIIAWMPLPEPYRKEGD